MAWIRIGTGSPPTREPGPDLSAPIPRMPDARSGSSLSKMNYGPRWAATNCQNKKCREGEPLLSHNYRSGYLSARNRVKGERNDRLPKRGKLGRVVYSSWHRRCGTVGLRPLNDCE
jgi:hypothetical protein